MSPSKRFPLAVIAFLLPALGFQLSAQSGDPAAIQQKLDSQIKLTKATADHTDIVTAGDVVVLHKDGLMMCSSASSYAFSNTYSNGVLTSNLNNRTKDAARSYLRGRLPFGGGGSAADAANNGCASRKFVAGEKFWVTAIVVQKDGILVSTFSDPYNDVRYYGQIKFPFDKGSVPPVDNAMAMLAQVLTVAPPADDQGGQGGQGGAPPPAPAAPAQAETPAPAPAPAPAPPPDIAPPPPPADVPPPTIALGQTIDQVTAAFGQPVRMANLGAKKIYYYKDMKVTFTNGKVSNVE